MKAKKTVLTILLATSTLAIGGLTFAIVKNGSLENITVHGDPVTYSTTLNESNRPEGLTSSFQNNFTGDVTTAEGNKVNLSFVNARSADGVFATLAYHGKIYNYGEGNSKMTGIEGVSFEGQGTLYFKPAIKYGDKAGILAEVDPVTVTAGAGIVSVPVCDCFEIEAADGGATISNLTFKYSCDSESKDVRMVNGTYTGKDSKGLIWKIVAHDGEVSIARLNGTTAMALSGSVEMLSKTQAKCTFVYMGAYHVFYTMNYDGHKLAFVSKSDDAGGAVAAQVESMDFYRVYNTEDFESYSATGQGYVDGTKKYQTTGMRAHYYADYYHDGSTGEIGGSGWGVMTSTDNSNLFTSGGNFGAKTGVFKFSNGMAMRYISMNELYGVKSLIGKGTTISFWTRGAYKMSGSNYVLYDKDIPTVKVYAYYNSPLTPSTQQTVREEFSFSVKQGTEWEQHTFTLNKDGRNYYGFGIWAQQSTGSAVYIPFDDFEIYTYDPHASYAAVTGVSLNKSETEITEGQTETLVATVAPDNASIKDVSWTSSDPTVATVDSKGVVTAVKAGTTTITVTTSEGSFTATCDVTVKAAVAKSYPEGTYKGIVTVNSANFDLVIAIGNKTNGLVSVKLSNAEAGATSISYDEETKVVTIPTTGNYSSLTYGTITGTYDPDTDTINNISVDGTIKGYVSNDGSITVSRVQYQYDCDGTTSELQSQFKRRYRSKGASSWSVDGSNTDRIQHESTCVSGTGAMSVRPCGSSFDAYGFSLQSDFASAQSVGNIGFWVYNSGSSNIKFRTYMYKSTGLSNHFQIGSMTATAGQWTYCCMGFGTQSGAGPIYNFNLSVWTSDNSSSMSVRLIFDNIVLF